MSEFKGTPGPWRAVKAANQVMHIDCPNGDPDLGHAKWHGMAVVYGCSEMGELGHRKAEANASIISAAPELLAALQEVVAISDRNHGAWDRAHAAIAKALGEDHE